MFSLQSPSGPVIAAPKHPRFVDRSGYSQKKEAGFIELVRPVAGNGTAGVTIRVDDRISIVLDRGFDEVTLKSALAAATERA